MRTRHTVPTSKMTRAAALHDQLRSAAGAHWSSVLFDGMNAHYKIAACLVVAFVVLALSSLSFGFVLPVGPLYWDLLIYYDAIGRINFGQLPSIDFMAPAGPAEYGLAWALFHLFPDAHPVLLTQFQWLPVTGIALIVILRHARSHGPFVIWGLTLVWLLMSALPFNPDGEAFPGVDAYGIYNRNGAHLMFLACAAILFVRNRTAQTCLFSALLLGLAFCKVTAFVAMAPLFLLGLMTGRIEVRTALATALVCVGAVGVLEVGTGIVSAYLSDLHTLLTLNGDGFGQRVKRAMEERFDVVIAGFAICGLLLTSVKDNAHKFAQSGGPTRLGEVLDRPVMWIATALLCGLFFEMQNTGGHPFAVLWPALLLLALQPLPSNAKMRALVYAAIAFMCVPMTADVLTRAAGVAVRISSYQPLEAPNLGVLGRISAKPRWVERADVMRTTYIENRDAYLSLAEQGELPSPRLYDDPDFQYLYLQEIENVAAAILTAENSTGARFASVFTIDFTSPLGFVLGKQAPRRVSIGAAPSRTVPPLSQETLEQLHQTDLILEPKCPIEAQQRQLARHYAPALEGRRKVQVTLCYDAHLRPGAPWLAYFESVHKAQLEITPAQPAG